jgi:hypothetical protein
MCNHNDAYWTQDLPLDVQQALQRGAEPFWMQDVRLAQRRLEAARLAARESAARSTDEGQAASDS